MEKIKDLSAYIAVNVRGVPFEQKPVPFVDPRAHQIEEAIKEILARGLVR